MVRSVRDRPGLAQSLKIRWNLSDQSKRTSFKFKNENSSIISKRMWKKKLYVPSCRVIYKYIPNNLTKDPPVPPMLTVVASSVVAVSQTVFSHHSVLGPFVTPYSVCDPTFWGMQLVIRKKYIWVIQVLASLSFSMHSIKIFSNFELYEELFSVPMYRVPGLRFTWRFFLKTKHEIWRKAVAFAYHCYIAVEQLTWFVFLCRLTICNYVLVGTLYWKKK